MFFKHPNLYYTRSFGKIRNTKYSNAVITLYRVYTTLNTL